MKTLNRAAPPLAGQPHASPMPSGDSTRPKVENIRAGFLSLELPVARAARPHAW
ncbi:MAG: hypothetical protein KF866_01100 [Phycisphaeraceae bacterium]|nr:hypothetical protein [Phycisphaeraceae bacterium]